ncbi:111_t:CDS:2, partial [Gigaspora rosea]
NTKSVRHSLRMQIPDWKGPSVFLIDCDLAQVKALRIELPKMLKAENQSKLQGQPFTPTFVVEVGDTERYTSERNQHGEHAWEAMAGASTSDMSIFSDDVVPVDCPKCGTVIETKLQKW